jgi:hypothetical protein
MRHLSDEELVGHFYGDGPLEVESAVEEHLRACSLCRASWDELTATLKMVDASAVPEPDPGFEERLWTRVQPALPGRPDEIGPWRVGTHPGRRWRVPSFAFAAAGLALAVTAAVLAMRESRPAAPVAATPAARAAADPKGRERVLLTGLDDHFQRSEILLVEVLNAPVTAGDELGFERQTADDLVDWGRLYRVAAQQNGNFRMAQMLEDLESVMVEIARSPDQMDRDEIGSLRSRIQDDNLLFKVRAVSRQIQDRRRDLSTQ